MRTLPVLLVLALAAAPARAQDNFERGQELFQHHCHACHGDLARAGQEGKVKSPAELKKRIGQWAAHTGADWGKSEIADVAHYMDKSFYHFDGRK